MPSQENEDLERIRHTIGGDFELSSVDETLSDAKLMDLSADAKAPSLSELKRQRLGSREVAPNPGIHADLTSRDDLFERFTTGAQSDAGASPQAAKESVRNRVYVKKPKTRSDLTEAFAAKPIVVSGTTGKITERG